MSGSMKEIWSRITQPVTALHSQPGGNVIGRNPAPSVSVQSLMGIADAS